MSSKGGGHSRQSERWWSEARGRCHADSWWGDDDDCSCSSLLLPLSQLKLARCGNLQRQLFLGSEAPHNNSTVVLLRDTLCTDRFDFSVLSLTSDEAAACSSEPLPLVKRARACYFDPLLASYLREASPALKLPAYRDTHCTEHEASPRSSLGYR